MNKIKEILQPMMVFAFILFSVVFVFGQSGNCRTEVVADGFYGDCY